MAVPAEEYVEIEYRNTLREEGKVHFLGGKQEFVKLGVMDDIDIMVMQHTANTENGIMASCGGPSNGFVGKLIRYIGKEAHAGGAPHLGINALNAANLGLSAVAMQRETFRDDDHIRVHPIMTKGGDLVNVVPADVRLETYVRGSNVEAILDASSKVSRAFKAGGDAVGATTVITDLPGYLPMVIHQPLYDVMYENLRTLVGDDHCLNVDGGMSGSTDAGDISHIMPSVQASIGGAEGIFHSESFEIGDKELAYVTYAKTIVLTLIDLLADGAEKAIEVKDSFKPVMTKEEYLRDWGNIEG